MGCSSVGEAEPEEDMGEPGSESMVWSVAESIVVVQDQDEGVSRSRYARVLGHVGATAAGLDIAACFVVALAMTSILFRG